MALALEQLTRQRQTLQSIRGVVRTMKSLAAINVGPYERAATAIGAYRRTLRRAFAAFVWRMGERAILPQGTVDGPSIWVVFGSDHGFCGNYNSQVAHTAQRASAHAVAPVVLCAGARMAAALHELGMPAQQVLMPPASVDGIGRLASQVVGWVERQGRGQALTGLRVHLVYMRRAEHGRRTPVVASLLPLPHELLQRPGRWPSRALPDFALPPQQLLAALVRNHIFSSVFQASAEAMVTENAARLALMQQAEEAVDERLEEVSRAISGVRQDQITDELMDLIMGHAQQVF